jgi:hypothetical protein
VPDDTKKSLPSHICGEKFAQNFSNIIGRTQPFEKIVLVMRLLVLQCDPVTKHQSPVEKSSVSETIKSVIVKIQG